MRRRRWRWLGVGLVVAIGLFFALDVVMVQYLESRGAAEIVRTMSAEDGTVDLGGFPFIPRFLRGRLTDVSVRVRGASASGGLRVRSIEARMAEVEFAPGEVFALARSSFATRTEIKADEPLGILELGEADLEDFIGRAVPLVGDVQVKGSGIEIRFLLDIADADKDEAELEKDKLTRPARYLPRVENGKLVLSLISVSQIRPSLRAEAARIESLINLPKIPGGLRSDVSLRDGVIVVESQGAKVELMVGEGES